jgi:ribosomal protein S18 acetylase RimI-like enzyme
MAPRSGHGRDAIKATAVASTERMSYRKAQIRPVRGDDEPHLFGLARMTFGGESGWSDERTLAVLAEERVFVAEVEDAVAGFVALDPSGEVVVIDHLLVAPAHEGEGVGRQLLAWAEGWAISHRARALQVAVEEENARAVDFYRRCGFTSGEPGVLELILPQG